MARGGALQALDDLRQARLGRVVDHQVEVVAVGLDGDELDAGAVCLIERRRTPKTRDEIARRGYFVQKTRWLFLRPLNRKEPQGSQ